MKTTDNNKQNKQLRELSDEELKQVSGGSAHGDCIGLTGDEFLNCIRNTPVVLPGAGTIQTQPSGMDGEIKLFAEGEMAGANLVRKAGN